jgi:hypothetical protein
MNRTATIGFAILACLSLAACNSATVASGPRVTNTKVASASGLNSKSLQQAPKTARRGDPLQASASYGVAASRGSVSPSTAMVAPGRYDSICRAKDPTGSSEYGACLQDLPASALVGGGGTH